MLKSKYGVLFGNNNVLCYLPSNQLNRPHSLCECLRIKEFPETISAICCNRKDIYVGADLSTKMYSLLSGEVQDIGLVNDLIQFGDGIMAAVTLIDPFEGASSALVKDGEYLVFRIKKNDKNAIFSLVPSDDGNLYLHLICNGEWKIFNLNPYFGLGKEIVNVGSDLSYFGTTRKIKKGFLSTANGYWISLDDKKIEGTEVNGAGAAHWTRLELICDNINEAELMCSGNGVNRIDYMKIDLKKKKVIERIPVLSELSDFVNGLSIVTDPFIHELLLRKGKPFLHQNQ